MAVRKLGFSTAIALLIGASLGGRASAQEVTDYPPNAAPGQCFARVWIPEVSESVAEQVVDVPERTSTRTIPAVYATATEQVVLKEQSVRYENVPATYKTVTENVLVEPERVEKTVVPARTETYQERVLVKEAYVTWKPGGKIYGRATPNGMVNVSNSGDTITTSTGEILCRVEVPAEYKTVTRTRIVEPEHTVERVIPAKYRQVTKQVIDQPATTREIIVPAVYGTQQVRKLVSEAREETNVIPATHKTVMKRVVRQPARMEWQTVLCDRNASPEKLMEVQNALTQAGFPTVADGKWGPQTLTAMESYQRSVGLPVGYLTLSTLKSLNVAAP